MMEQDLINMIGSVGFPIVACIYMAMVHKEDSEQRLESEQRHADERNKMTEALVKMNATLEYILDWIKGESNDAKRG
jgi:hypothetical protein